MFKVFKHGPRRIVTDPRTQTEQEMRLVVFMEEGRGGANPSLSKSSSYLDQLVGEKTGLDQRRTHSQLVRIDKLDKYELGRQFPGHINRIITSTPQMEQQVNVSPRMIEGKIVYFITELGPTAEEDRDLTIKTDILMAARPELFTNVNFRPAEVRQIDEPMTVQETEEANQNAGQPAQNAPQHQDLTT